MVYLDITLLVNGAMDAILLGFTAHLLRKKVNLVSLFIAVVLGQLPIILILFDFSALTSVSRAIIPLVMVGIGLKTKSIRDLAKGLLCFSLLTAVSGGIFYAITGWLGFGVGEGTFLTLKNLWLLPLMVLILIGGCRGWEKLQKINGFMDNVLYDAELFFDNDKILEIKALLDTGNELRDPMTDTPVMILEEREAQKVLSEQLKQFLLLPWEESPNPWTFIWNSDDDCIRKMIFISAKGINGQTWLPGIRLKAVKISQDNKVWERPITVAFVKQSLNSEGKFQALLHPEHIHKAYGKEEIA